MANSTDTEDSKGKTSRRSSDITEERRKKKSKRRSSQNGNVSENDLSDFEGQKKRSSSSRKKISTKSKKIGNPGLKDSLTMKKRKKSVTITVEDYDSSDDDGPGEPRREKYRQKKQEVSFTKSTILREENKNLGDAPSAKPSMKDKIRARGMGQGQSQSAFEGDGFGRGSFSLRRSNSALDDAMGKLPQDDSVESNKSEQRPSKFAMREVNFADSPDGEGKTKFKSNGTYDSPDRPRKTSFSSMNSDDLGDSAESFQRRPSRRSTRSDSEPDTKASLSRPRIQRRDSLKNSLIGSEDEKGHNGTNVKASVRGSIVESLVGSVTNNEKHIRRSKMSVENQVYVPPRNRRKSIVQAMAHVMAGRTVELVMWTYGASFGKVMLFFLTFYIVNIFVWAGVMDLVDQTTSGGDCIHGEDAATLSAAERYELAFELSWSTFTTVGYGAVSPPGGETGCYAIRLVCAFVAFTGVLFGSTTAAIMYSKLMRLLAHAHVTFSSTLCVQYGKGTEGGTVRYGQLNFRASVSVGTLKALSAQLLNDDDSKEEEATGGSEDGYPVIEFRMMNDRANHEGSEIWDAQISAIVQLHKEKTGDGAGALKTDNVAGGGSTLDLEKKVYYPISLTPNTHPHFSRIWYARHVLNEESPLLKREIRDMIAVEKKWDPDFNTWKEIRDCLNPFISLRVTLSGTSAVSASTVFAEHVYEFDDVCVGWRFANMVYEKNESIYNRSWWRQLGFGSSEEEDSQEDNPDSKTQVDKALLHDIVPQPGGDFEPMEDDSESVFHLFTKRD